MTARTVLVTGPALSGASTVAAALRVHLEGCQVTESASGRADVVVFVLSAAAPLANCDAALLAAAADDTDAVVAVVAKIDVHRTWRETLEINRAVLARYAGRYRTAPWVGAAAGPHIGPQVIEPLLEAVRASLRDGGRRERNRTRAGVVRADRAAHGPAPAAQRTALRADVRRIRLELGAQARARALSLREDLQQQAAVASRREITSFDQRVRTLVSAIADDFDQLVRHRFAEVHPGQGLAFPDIAAPPVWEVLPPLHRSATDPTVVVVAVTFGLGAALTLCRLLSELLSGVVPWPLAGAGALGLALGVWVTRARNLFAARLATERWVAEVSAGLRSALEDRVLAAESALLATIAAGGRRQQSLLRADVPITGARPPRVNLQVTMPASFPQVGGSDCS